MKTAPRRRRILLTLLVGTGLSLSAGAAPAMATAANTSTAAPAGYAAAGPHGTKNDATKSPATASLLVHPGYRLVGRDGGVFDFGARFFGSLPGRGTRVTNIVGMVSADAAGYWLVAADGTVYDFGDARDLGSLPGHGGNVRDIVGIASPDPNGYWLVADNGTVWSFGDAHRLVSLSSLGIHNPDIVGIASAGAGYRLVGADGGVFALGTRFLGSLPAEDIHVYDIVGIADSGDGYRLVGSAGVVYGFGGSHTTAPAGGSVSDVAGIASADPTGYWLASADGAVFAGGDAVALGSMAGTPLGQPIVAIARVSPVVLPPGSFVYLCSLLVGTFADPATVMGTVPRTVQHGGSVSISQFETKFVIPGSALDTAYGLGARWIQPVFEELDIDATDAKTSSVNVLETPITYPIVNLEPSNNPPITLDIPTAPATVGRWTAANAGAMTFTTGKAVAVINNNVRDDLATCTPSPGATIGTTTVT